MEDKKLLKEFYLIADELDENIIRFNELEEKLKVAKETGDEEAVIMLLEEYREVASNVKRLKERSQKLKEES